MDRLLASIHRGAGILTRIPPQKAVISLLLNSAKKVGISRPIRASHSHISELGIEGATRLSIEMYRTLASHIGDVGGKVGLEIGPGDNLGLAECFLAAGASRLVCVEQFATVHQSDELRQRIRAELGGNGSAYPELVVLPFETLFGSEKFDFIYSVDVLEHVSDPAAAAKCIAGMLNPGGVSVHSVDFAGHNAYSRTRLDFLTCPDWVWWCLHSSLETTNRVRLGELIRAFETGNLKLESVTPLIETSNQYVETLRPFLNARFADLPTSDLRVLQAIIKCKQPN